MQKWFALSSCSALNFSVCVDFVDACCMATLLRSLVKRKVLFLFLVTATG